MSSTAASVRLDGLAVVITGSGRGIGAACAVHAASLGAMVVVNDVDAVNAEAVAREIRDSGGIAVPHQADVAVRAEAATLIGRCVTEFGRIDGLVNNAALMSLGRLEDHDEAHLRHLLDVNVVGGFNCASEAIVVFYAQGSGSIVNVTSGAHLGMSAASDYAATKGAVASMTYSWAIDAAGTGVRVNALSPLAISAMSAQTQAYLRGTGLTDLVIEAPTPAESAPAVCYLLSDASAHLNGQIVRADGPRLSLMAHPAITQPVLHRESWSADDIARAFAVTLDHRQSPTGLAWTAEPATLLDPGWVEFD